MIPDHHALPTEIFAQIIHLLPPKNAVDLATTCKALYRICAPHFYEMKYEKVLLGHDKRAHKSIISPVKFLILLLKDRNLMSYVKSIQLLKCNHEGSHNGIPSSNDAKLIRDAIQGESPFCDLCMKLITIRMLI